MNATKSLVNDGLCEKINCFEKILKNICLIKKNIWLLPRNYNEKTWQIYHWIIIGGGTYKTLVCESHAYYLMKWKYNIN